MKATKFDAKEHRGRFPELDGLINKIGVNWGFATPLSLYTANIWYDIS